MSVVRCVPTHVLTAPCSPLTAHLSLCSPRTHHSPPRSPAHRSPSRTTHASLTSASLTSASLTSASLTHASLTHTSLTHAARLPQAAFHSRNDAICGVSECIIMGIPIQLGTGIFHLLQRVPKFTLPKAAPLLFPPPTKRVTTR